MTLTDALARYLAFAPDLKPRTRGRMQTDVNRWLRLGGPLDGITKETVSAFRIVAGAKLSPWTVEQTVSTVLQLLKHVAADGEDIDVPFAGRRLRRRKELKHVPSVADLAAVYDVAGECDDAYPDFWKAYIVVGYTTGLRLSDMLELEWEHVGESKWLKVAAKTSKIHALPMFPFVRMALNRLRKRGDRLFPISGYRVRRQLVRLSKRAGVESVRPQAIRRTAANAYESARPGAGSVILGHAIGSGASAFYLSVPRILEEAAERLEIPATFFGKAYRLA